MWVGTLAVLVLCACGGAVPVVVENRGGTASHPTCPLSARFDLEARRYANLDADQPDYQTWSAWRVGIQLGPDRKVLRGTLAMLGDELVWNFDVTGELDERCQLALWTDTHEPMTVTIDVRARTGTIRSIDDVWLLGPPFPTQRP